MIQRRFSQILLFSQPDSNSGGLKWPKEVLAWEEFVQSPHCVIKPRFYGMESGKLICMGEVHSRRFRDGIVPIW